MEVWNRLTALAARLRLKKTGLKRLRREVRMCEYEDVRVLWDMLTKADAEIARSSPAARRKKKGERRKNVCSSVYEWACLKI